MARDEVSSGEERGGNVGWVEHVQYRIEWIT